MNRLLHFLLFCFLIQFAHAQRTVGLLSYKPWKSYDGYNLLYPHNQPHTYLIDNCGEIVHVWEGEADRRPGNTAYIQENGDLIRTSRGADITQDPIWAGGGGERVEIRTWDNEVKWEYSINDSLERLHHDIAVLPDGNILMIVWELKNIEACVQAGRDTSTLTQNEMWPDKIIEVDPTNNEIVWEWHAWDHLVQDQFPDKDNFGVVAENPGKIDVNWDTNSGKADWMHSNAIDFDPINNQILLSVPQFHEIWVIDHSTTTEQAAGSTGGFSGKGGDLIYRWGNNAAYDQGDESDQQLFYQHDVQIVDDFLTPSHPYFGKFAAFNNRVGADYSSVVIWDNTYDMYDAKFQTIGDIYAPETFALSKTHPIPTELYSTGLSSVQVLPNNNLLICDGRHGYSFEMTPEDEVVWEYVTPLKGGAAVEQGDTLDINNNLTFRMKRYPIDFAGFEGRTLEGDGFIEVGGDEAFCDQILPVEMSYINDDLKVYPNPTAGFVTLEWESKLYEEITILNTLGQVMYNREHSGGRIFLDVSSWDAGQYFIRTSGQGITKLIITK